MQKVWCKPHKKLGQMKIGRETRMDEEEAFPRVWLSKTWRHSGILNNEKLNLGNKRP